MMKNRKILAMFLALSMTLSLVACGTEDVPEETTTTTTIAETTTLATQAAAPSVDELDWVVYWYLCGSDLESGGGSATTDISELLEAKLPENVKIIIQTGGASEWQNNMFSADKLGRYVYDSNGLKLIEEVPQASMGDAQTLSDFLAFAKTNYPAKKTGFVFWNHGGGSVSGAASDENFGGDALTLDEMYNAFGANYELSIENPPFEMIGFDTCLMATVDVAFTFSDIGKYLVASQETEPANGWQYTAWAGALGQNPQMEGLELGTIICDTYLEGCEAVDTADNITLSVTNLAKLPELLTAYENFGKEALANACTDPAFISEFGRIANTTENYGGNTKEQGFTNMADLGHLARKSLETLSETSGNVLDSLDSCVEYKVQGPYREESTGLSCYYSFNGDVDDFNGYAAVGAGEAFKYYYNYSLTGELSDEGMAYISEMNYDTLPELETLATQGWDNIMLDVDDEGSAILNLGEKAAEVLSGVYINLYYVDAEQDMMLLLGVDNDLVGDWETGVFKDNFRGVWGAINGNIVYMELSQEGEDYNMYTIPILLNGEEYNLDVVYDFTTETYEILGAKQSINEYGMADKNLRYLVEGDVITTIHYMSSISDENADFTAVEVDTITVDENIAFTETELGDGAFIQLFEMRDPQGNAVYSDVVQFDIANGEITTTVGLAE